MRPPFADLGVAARAALAAVLSERCAAPREGRLGVVLSLCAALSLCVAASDVAGDGESSRQKRRRGLAPSGLLFSATALSGAPPRAE